ncbi:hypothetical protein Nepgr_001853 [Nepenthes gracilis]|uniref:SNF2 N-terminal domain-containing protein n=1 Tax=Nepenthes gracilis TaxID=150966 RepID=A0AAD3P569_NEPGR|nr:hypothetical protein Nepgr_001853 [Nepenthes gracilis]
MAGNYQSDGEQEDAHRIQNKAAAAENNEVRMQTSQPSGRISTWAWKWVSTLCRDFQHMSPCGDLEHESRSRSENKNDEGNASDGGQERLESDDYEEQKEMEKVRADEMLSDEYFEQDGEDQNDALHYSSLNHPISQYSRPLSKPNVETDTYGLQNLALAAWRGRISEKEFSVNDSEDDGDEDFATRRNAHPYKSRNVGQKNETLTSSRSVCKVSFVESKDLDEAIKKNLQRLWYCWYYTLVYVPLSSVLNMQLSDYKKVLNYIKKVTEDVTSRKSVSLEEGEYSVRFSPGGKGSALSSCCTICKEKDVDISFAQNAVGEYKHFDEEITGQFCWPAVKTNAGQLWGWNFGDHEPTFGDHEQFFGENWEACGELDKQPEWLKGGKLRDIQLGDLIFLVNWALLHLLDPHKFRNKEDFVENCKKLISVNETELANLHMEWRPCILRRVIKDVEKPLPPKIEHILRVEMSPLQKQ